MSTARERIISEIDALTPAEVFLRYYGATPAARRELANGHEPSADDVHWMRMELHERADNEQRRASAA